MKNENYDLLKKIAQVILPAVTLFVGVVLKCFDVECTDIVVTIMTAFDTMLGTILGVSTKNYNKGVKKMSKISLEKFIEKTKGTQVDVPWVTSPSKLKGQCVSLVQTYLQECLEQPAMARGNAKDWIQSYVEEGLGHTSAEQENGDLIVFPNEADGYGHIAIYFEGKLYDQNNLRHDNGLAGFGEIFNNDYVTLRPNTEVIVYEPKNNILVLPASAESWRVYPMDKKPTIGNECGKLLPSKFGGLEYEILGYTMNNVAIIQTRDFGQVQIYVEPSTGAVIK